MVNQQTNTENTNTSLESFNSPQFFFSHEIDNQKTEKTQQKKQYVTHLFEKLGLRSSSALSSTYCPLDNNQLKGSNGIV